VHENVVYGSHQIEFYYMHDCHAHVQSIDGTVAKIPPNILNTLSPKVNIKSFVKCKSHYGGSDYMIIFSYKYKKILLLYG